MKRCPKCNRAYSTDTQKFCTHDGGLLFTVDETLTETVQFDSAKVRDKVSHPTTRDLGEQKAAFDPEATVVTGAPGEGSQAPRARDTGSLEAPQQTQYYGAPPTAATVIDSAPPPPPPPAPPSQPAAPPPTASSGPIAPPSPTPSGPITPPASPVAPSGPIAPPAAQAAAAAAQPSQPLATAPPKKKSKLPLILGLVALLLLLFVGAAAAAGYFFVIKPRQEAKAAAQPVTAEPTTTAPSLPTTTPAEPVKPSNEPPPYNPPADAVQFVNAKDELSGRLAENFVAFSFYYPNRWIKVPSGENFVTVERRLPPDFTQENFGVAPWYAPEGTTTFDDAFFKELASKDDANFAKKFPEYRKVSEGPTKVGTYDAYEFRFEGVSRGTDKGDVTLWGREIFFAPREGEKTGIKFLILTTSLAPELKSIDDAGVKGELPMILESFRFGK